MTKFKKAAASIAAIIAIAGLGAALYSCGSETDSPSGDMGKGNPDRNAGSYYNHVWLEGPAGKTEFDENSLWGAYEWEDLFHAFKKGDKSFTYSFTVAFGYDSQGRFERHLKAAGIPYAHRDRNDGATIVDVTKIISIRGKSIGFLTFMDAWTDWK
jgi:hypothetical protein